MGTKYDEDIETKTEIDIDQPQMLQVFLLNDDYTSMDFVVEVLMEYFHKTLEESINIMLRIHHVGSGLCGTYPYDIAETKIELVTKEAKSRQFPLQCVAQEI